MAKLGTFFRDMLTPTARGQSADWLRCDELVAEVRWVQL